jgi:hypothetical protein
MKSDFVLREIILNQAMQNMLMWVDDEKKTIKYVKVVAQSPIVMVHFTDGTVIETNENKNYTFEVNNKLHWKKATRRQIKQSTNNM